MKPPKSEPVVTRLDPNHPNHDALLLKRARLEAHRRRRRENRGESEPSAETTPTQKPAKTSLPSKKPRKPRKG